MGECVVRMEMPNGCHDCKLRNMVGNCPIPMFDGQDEKKIWTLAECFQRPPWCPIICQLPEGHGRLVDADKLGDEMKARKCFIGRMSDPDCLVFDAPTIVPAERSET